jgi:hypothetical protein
VTSSAGSVITGAKEDESSTERVWPAGFHRVTARSRLAGVLKLTNRLFLQFSVYFSGRVKPRITESVNTGARLYIEHKRVLILSQFLSVKFLILKKKNYRDMS